MDELSGVTHMPAHALRRKIAFWQSHGLLKEESSDSFLLMEEQPGHGGHDLLLEDDEAESAMASSKDQKEEEMQVGSVDRVRSATGTSGTEAQFCQLKNVVDIYVNIYIYIYMLSCLIYPLTSGSFFGLFLIPLYPDPLFLLPTLSVFMLVSHGFPHSFSAQVCLTVIIL